MAGLPPRDASDRLNMFQLHFDDFWRKLETLSGGEELFGLEVTEYPDLQRVRKELSLLQKLYQLYNGVLERVRSYYDIAWIDVNVANISAELIDFQNKYVPSVDFGVVYRVYLTCDISSLAISFSPPSLLFHLT